MGKKIWYSQCLTDAAELFNKTKKHLQESNNASIKNDDVFNYFRQRVALEQDSNKKVILLNQIALWQFVLTGKQEVKHIFFKDKELRDYLQEMPLSDLQGIKQYIKDNGNSYLLPTLDKSRKTLKDTFVLCLHVPYEKSGYSYLFHAGTEIDITCEYKSEPFCFVMTDGRYEGLVKNKANSKEDEDDLKAFRLAINTIAYINCFPECVIDGVPQNYTEPQYSDFNVTLEKSEQFIEIEKRAKSQKGNAVTPHFRKGYFKLLRSERFTHKRGQIIFAHPTMVKGTAQTVLTNKSIGLSLNITPPDDETILSCKTEDEKIIADLKTNVSDLKEKSFVYSPSPKILDVAEQVSTNKKIFLRDRQTTLHARARAKYRCEYDPRHEVFIRKHSDKGYTEAHHLIPMEYQESFLPYSLDVEANIVSLCSNCHNQIHYGKDANKIIQKLYNKRKNELETVKLPIDIDDLLKMY